MHPVLTAFAEDAVAAHSSGTDSANQYKSEIVLLYDSSMANKAKQNNVIKDMSTYKAPKMIIIEFATSLDPDEVAHDLHCLPFSL